MKKPSSKKTIYLLLTAYICFSLSPLHANAQSDTYGLLKKLMPNLENHGFYKTEIAYRFRQQSTVTKALNSFQLTQTHPVGQTAQITMISRLFYDPIYDLSSPERLVIPKAQLDVDYNNLSIDYWGVELKELYLSLYFDNFDLIAGKQIVRWGELEGFDISDRLNPQDFGEFIFRDVEDRYIPLWMTKTDIYLGDVSTEVIWIPDLRFHEPAQTGTEFEEFRLPPDLSRPAITFRNSEWAVRTSFSVNDIDMAIGTIYAWDDFPSAFRSVFGLGNKLSNVSFNPRYTRLHNYFTTFSKSFDSLVLAGEAGYITGKFFGTAPDTALGAIGESKKDHIKAGLGVTLVVMDFDLIIQVVEDVILNYDEMILQDRREDAVSLFIRRKFNYDKITFQCLVLLLVNNQDFLSRPRLDYKLSDRVTVSVGADMFNGDSGDLGIEDFQFIGFFNQHDRFYTEFKYSF